MNPLPTHDATAPAWPDETSPASQDARPGEASANYWPTLLNLTLFHLGMAFDALVWLPGTWIFVAIPIIDAVLGPDRRPASGLPDASGEPHWLALALNVTWYAVLMATFGWRVLPLDVTSPMFWALCFNGGLATGVIAVVLAHEVGHRRDTLAGLVSECLLLPALMPQFRIAHNESHHRLAATPEDTSTSRENQGAWAYMVRSCVGGHVAAWRIESLRLRHLEGLRWVARHRMLRRTGFHVAAFAIVTWWYPSLGLAWLVCALVANALFEFVNYLGHYGLERRRTADGYEPVTVAHAWNSDHFSSRVILFELGRHSDHHAHARQPFHTLSSSEASPQLPYGYATMILISAVPPLWRRVMNPRLQAWRSRQASGMVVGQANPGQGGGVSDAVYPHVG